MRKFLPDIRTITRLALLLALTLAIQAFRLPTVVTGPLVNFMLILTTILTGTIGGVFVGFITPWIALLAGILAAPLAPAVPFIMAGNAVYCLIFGLLKKTKTGMWLAVLPASVVKFCVIGGAASYLLELPAPLTQVLLFPQLINALIGGAAAAAVGFYLLRILNTASVQ